jgi:hypothetical protein
MEKNFSLNDLKTIDTGIFVYLLISMEVTIDTDKTNPDPSIKEVNEHYFGHDNFPKVKAKEIIKKLFSQSEKEKLTSLMSELKANDHLLIAKARLEKFKKFNEHEGTLTREVFEEVEKEFSDALDLLGLIRIEPNHFKESYAFLAEM